MRARTSGSAHPIAAMPTRARAGTDVSVQRRPAWRARAGAAVLFAAVTACARNADVEPPPATSPPQAGAVAIAIDSAALIRDVAVLAHDSMEGRGVATPGSHRARVYL